MALSAKVPSVPGWCAVFALVRPRSSQTKDAVGKTMREKKLASVRAQTREEEVKETSRTGQRLAKTSVNSRLETLRKDMEGLCKASCGAGMAPKLRRRASKRQF